MPGNGLKRSLGLFPATNIVIANIIGAGIFTTSGLLMADLGSPLLLIVLWAVGGIIAICGALSYGELGANMPEAGGEYMFLSRIFHPALGFLSGWVSFIVGFSAPIAASALGFSDYLIRAFPGLAEWISGYTFLSVNSTGKMFAVVVVLAFTLIHSRGIKSGSKVQNILTILKIVLVTGLIVAGLAFGDGNVENFRAENTLGNGLSGWKTIGLSVMWIMFAYSGWNASTYIGSEIKKPKLNLPGSLLIGTGLVIILYLLLNAVYIYAIPPGEMKGVISVGGLAMGRLFGPGAETVFSLLIAFALFSSLSAYIIIGPRVYFSMARDGLFFKSVAKIHHRHNVPTYSIYLQSLIAIIFILTGTFDQILTYMGFSLGIFPILTIAGSFKIRKTGKIQTRIPGFPVPQLVYISTGLMILVLSFMERPVESSIALGTVAAGIPAYLLFRKYS
ncbi:MAG TPA: amino acid permease [Bacteroidetes bacterium]|nr:amino acid permease [Bacteroidota bacterium]